MLGRFLFEDSKFQSFWALDKNGEAYQNTATIMCSQPPQTTKMREAQRLHLIHHHIPKKKIKKPQPEALPNPRNLPRPSPPQKRQSIHITHNHSQMQKHLQLPKNIEIYNHVQIRQRI